MKKIQSKIYNNNVLYPLLVVLFMIVKIQEKLFTLKCCANEANT